MRRNIAVFGQERWSRRLVATLNEYAPDTETRASYWSPETLLHLRLPGEISSADVLVRVGFRPGAHTARGRVFDCAWSRLRRQNPDAAVVCYWIGTDVLNTMQEWKAGLLTGATVARINACRNLAVSQNLVQELGEMKISSCFVPFPDALPRPTGTCVLPTSLTVAMYIPDARAAFYGGDILASVARAMPEVAFLVAGGNGSWLKERPANIQFLGWCSDMPAVFARCSIYLRLVPHDGLPRTVIEALACGRQVIYSQPFPYCSRVRFDHAGEEVPALLRRFQQAYCRGTFPVNTPGQAYVMNTYQPRVLAMALLREIGIASEQKPEEQR